MDLRQTIKNTMLTSDVPLHIQENTPPQYEDREHEFYSHETLWFIDKYAKYSSDYTDAQIQGLDPTKPFEYVPCHIRLADVITESASQTNQIDDHKNILIAEKEYVYLRKGAKVLTMGSTWLVTNAANLSGGDGQGLIQKCDGVWHYLDFYGNVCEEPFIATDSLRANDPDAQRSTMVAKGYFTAKFQYNDVVKSLLANNSRMILGSGAYHLSGFMDFIREFTSVKDSVRIIEVTMRYEEPNFAIDDMVNEVAGGLTFNWQIIVEGKKALGTGGTTKLTASSIRTYENDTRTVASTEEYPITYEWSTSDPNVCTVGTDGVVTAVSEGSAVITCTLVQNPDITAQYEITVEGSAAEPHIEFNSIIPGYMKAYSTLIVAATYYENGQATTQPLEWSVSGATPGTYSYIVEKVYETEDGNYTTDPFDHPYIVSAAKEGIVVKCWGGSVEPLVITASYGDVSATATIPLVGI